MKKMTIFALAAVLALCFAACGKKTDNNAVTTTPTTENAMLPQMDPTMDTNIPDDEVNGNSTDTTGTTEDNGNTDTVTTPADNGQSSRNMK